MQSSAPTSSEANGTSWRRRIVAGLTFFVSLSLVAAVAPALSRDRGSRGARSVASRASCGSQEWDVHHEGCELPLHVSEAEAHAASVRSTGEVSGSTSDDTSSFLRDDAPEICISASYVSFQLAPAETVSPALVAVFDSAAPRLRRSRAPPLT